MKNKLLERAKELHGDIKPCNGWDSWENCFGCMSEYGGADDLILWFNDEKDSTHIIKQSQLN